MRSLTRTAAGFATTIFLAAAAAHPASPQRLDASRPTIANRSLLSADVAFPLANGGASIGGKPVGWLRSVLLSAQEAKRIENSRCVFDLSYNVSNLGTGPAGPFSDMVRPVPADASTGTAAPQTATEQTGLSLGPRETKSVRTEVSLEPGSWFVVVKGDASGQVMELVETENNEGRFRVTLTGTCDGTHWGKSGEDYRSYLLGHLVARDLRVGGVPGAVDGGIVRLDARTLPVAGGGACLIGLDYRVENHGPLATQPFTSAVQIGPMPHPTQQQVPVAALAPGAVAAAHAVVGLPEGPTVLTIHPVLVTSSSGVQQYGANGIAATVTIEGSCRRR